MQAGVRYQTKLCLICTLLALAAGPAPAGPRPRSRAGAAQGEGFKHYLRLADQHYEAKEYDQAIAAWYAARALRPVPALLFAIAQAHELAGRPAQARDAYLEFLREARGPADKLRQARVRIAALDATLGVVRSLEARQELAEQRLAERAGPAPDSPLLDAGVGLIIGGRSFSFDEEDPPSPVRCYALSPPDAGGTQVPVAQAGCPRFHSTAAPGLRLDATVFPLTRVRFEGLTGRGRQALLGLGAGATLDFVFWPASTLRSSDHTASLSTSEVRAELGLRWVFPLVPRLGIAVRAMLQYGLHRFALDKEDRTVPSPADPLKSIAIVDNHGLPEVLYQYIDLGAGVRLPYYGSARLFVGTVLDLHYHAMLDYGEIGTRFVDPALQDGGYGPVGSGYGVRIDWAPLELQAFRGLTVRAQVYYERFGMSFTLADANAGYLLPPAGRTADGTAQHYARGATDQYVGGVLYAAYQY